MASTKEQLISRARENVNYYTDTIERLNEEGECCCKDVIIEIIRLDLELAIHRLLDVVDVLVFRPDSTEAEPPEE